MASKLSFSALTNSKSLEIKMTNILSFYEDLASCLAFKSGPVCFEVITTEGQIPINSTAENIVKFAKPLQRSNDIVNYLIEREQRQSL
ncbi:MAG: hypothetical protein ACC653_07520 [Gammaproteobacteria bacterium]